MRTVERPPAASTTAEQAGSRRPWEGFFDYQSTTPVDPRVLEAMLPFFREYFGNAHSGEHHFGRQALHAVNRARDQIGRCVGCDPEDLVFVSGATEANNLAILGSSRANVSERDVILVSAIEHSSVLDAAKASGLKVVTIPVDRAGFVDLDALVGALTERVLIVSVGAVNNEIGTVQDIATIGHLAHSAGTLVHVDAAQALAAMSLCLSRSPVDFVSLSAHKAYGPKGIGALYIAPHRRRYLKRLLHGGSQERGLRAGTLPTALCVGFGAACEILERVGDAEFRQVAALRDRFLEEISLLIPTAVLIGATGRRHPGNLSIRLPVDDARDVVQRIELEVACSTGSACHSGSESPSHVLQAVGMSLQEARRVIRLGIGRFTVSADCDRAAKAISVATQEILANT